MAEWVDSQGAAGWYFRVLQAGEVAPGGTFTLIDRPHPSATLERYWQLKNTLRPAPADLLDFAATSALTPAVAEKLRRQIEQERFQLPGNQTLQLSVSIGLALHDGHPDYQHTLRRADEALYAAKHGGRNRVVVAKAR